MFFMILIGPLRNRIYLLLTLIVYERSWKGCVSFQYRRELGSFTSSHYLITGIFGLTVLFLVPTSWLALKIKNDMYNKIVIPCCFIFFHAIFYNIVLKIWIASSISIGQILQTTMINSAGFLGFWSITKQPFHD